MTDSLRIFIGYDHRQPVSYNVLQFSILHLASKPVMISPLKLPTLPIKRQGMTPFTFSRFLVPHLCDYKGWALFLDLDMLLLDDISKLFDLADDKYAVMVVKNEIRFEWASSILFNCGHEANKILTPEYVEDPNNVTMHGMGWLDDELVGGLPSEWNHLIGYDTPRPDAKLVHYTQGMPFHPEASMCEYADEWAQASQLSGRSLVWKDIMGPSKHALTLPDGRVLPRLHPDAVEEIAKQSDQAETS